MTAEAVPSRDLALILSQGPLSVLLIGSNEATDAALRHFSACFATPRHKCELPGALRLPRKSGGALLLRDVGALNRAQQQQLLDWLEKDHGRTQIVSMTVGRLLHRVERGDFSERLYYLLNIVLADVNGARSQAP